MSRFGNVWAYLLRIRVDEPNSVYLAGLAPTMPDIPAAALRPILAAQIVARNIPTAAASTIGIEAPTAVAGTTPMDTMPIVTAPTTKLGSPTMAGSPASGPAAGSST
jgi:hypothetical protein